MYVTTSYVGIRRGRLDYLFYLLTEDYIEANKRIAEALHPLLSEFGVKLGHKGAVVKPFDGHASKTFEEVINRYGGVVHERFHDKTPGLLAIDSDLQKFDPSRDQYLFVSLRSSMDKSGNVSVFEVNDLLNALTAGVQRGNLFESVGRYFVQQEDEKAKKEFWEAVQLKPGVFGFSVDLKVAARALKHAFT